MEGIYDSAPRHYMPFVRYKISFRNDILELLLDAGSSDDLDGAMLLLSSFGLARTTDRLIPCFDLNEMSRRNKAKQKEIR